MTDEQLTEVLGELWASAIDPYRPEKSVAITRAKERLAALTPAGGVEPSNKIIGGLQEAVRGEFTAVHIRPTDALVKHMVERFLGWRLPEDFHPDDGISFSRTGINGVSYPMPMGTNLLDYTQAEAMVRYLLATLETKEKAGLGIPSGPENRCTHVLRAQGLPYPRTCQVCRLGPCPFKDKYAPIAETK